ncbi:MAG: T9SS type A sorting domain-containing protein [Bacteroidales bacterium]|nr:T9SS type A sorting domain-containing protein [Bacteroidales bacterium]
MGNYSYDNFRISPRSAADVVVVNAVPTNTISNLKVYPNPFNDAIHFNGANVSRVTITSIIGQVVMDVNANGLQTINTQHLQKGIYVVRFTNNNGESVLRKLIKQ